jgi:predicted dehydrogenase
MKKVSPNQSTPSTNLSRRRFLARTGAAMVLPLILPSTVLGRAGRRSPNSRINIGVVGWGMQGPSNTKNFLSLDDCKVVAACDLDKDALQDAVNTVNQQYQNQDCAAYHDYREMMARPDLDAVMLAVPDHWHALVATHAAGQGLDIYGEKPLAKTIHEQQWIVRAVEKNNRIWQTGSWQRSGATFRKAAEIVRNGLIGKVTRVEVGLPYGYTDFKHTAPELKEKLAALPEYANDFSKIVPGSEAWNIAVTPPPPELDYETWIGPSRMEPYIKQRVLMNWRWNYNTGGGQLLDWVGHHLDIAHWGLGFDRLGPYAVAGHGEFPAADALWNTCTKYRIEMQYPEDITITMAGGHDDIKSGTKWIGTDGWVWVDRSGFTGSNDEWKKYKNLPDDLAKIKGYDYGDKGPVNHWQNFLDCVNSRKPTIAPVQTAHHSAIPGHLGLISMLTGRKLAWSVEHQKILGDPEASKLLTRPYRAPYKLG